MKFDDYLQGELVPKRLPSSWVTNKKFVFQSDDGSLAILDTANDSVTTLVTNHTMVRFTRLHHTFRQPSLNNRLFHFRSFPFSLHAPGSLQRQINVKSKFDIVMLTNRKLNGDNVASIFLGYQCSNDLRYVLFTHNVKYVSSAAMVLFIGKWNDPKIADDEREKYKQNIGRHWPPTLVTLVVQAKGVRVGSDRRKAH